MQDSLIILHYLPTQPCFIVPLENVKVKDVSRKNIQPSKKVTFLKIEAQVFVQNLFKCCKIWVFWTYSFRINNVFKFPACFAAWPNYVVTIIEKKIIAFRFTGLIYSAVDVVAVS